MTDWITAHWGETAALVVGTLLTLIQLSPLKVNPWSWVATKIGRALNKETIAAVNAMREDLDKHVKLDEERFIKQCRMRVLRFNDEILQEVLHTKEHYDEILDDITEYMRYCRTHPDYENSKAEMAISNVQAKYQQHLAEKDFL